jgi:alanyl-tRNA synthetase
MAYRVLADHIRTLTFSISDGGMPSNEGRGYVLRRILRRAVRYAHEKLNAPAGFFASLVDVVVENFGEAFPEITKDPKQVRDILIEEETQFRKTLERGIVQFQKFATKARAENGSIISGTDAWRLYDTYGFPVDLTQLMADETGLKVDKAGYEQAQEIAREVSRASRVSGDHNQVVIDVHLQAQLEKAGIPITVDDYKYDSNAATLQAKIQFIIKSGSQTESVDDSSSELVGIILDKTNFYAEQGGQASDWGTLTLADESAGFQVVDAQVYGGYVLHVGKVTHGSFKQGQEVLSAFDETRRRPLRQNHTATHLLNFALRSVLDNNRENTVLEQQGSLVAADKLRFDYSFNAQPTPEQVADIESKVAEMIRGKHSVLTRVTSLSDAKSIVGLRAVFGETYPDPVRVVAVGPSLSDLEEVIKNPAASKWMNGSLELCGGTHVSNSADIKDFLIVSEGAISKGSRRIVAFTGEAAAQARIQEASIEKRLSGASSDESVRTLTKDIDECQIGLLAKNKLRDRLNALRKELIDKDKAEKQAQAKLVTEELVARAKASPSPCVVAKIQVGDDQKAITFALNALKSIGKDALLYSVGNDKVYYQTMTSNESLDGVAWAKAFEAPISGRSGGKKASAQGTAPIDPSGASIESKLQEAELLANDFCKKLNLLN